MLIMGWIMQGVREGIQYLLAFAVLGISIFYVSQQILDRRWSGHSADLDVEVQIHLVTHGTICADIPRMGTERAPRHISNKHQHVYFPSISVVTRGDWKQL